MEALATKFEQQVARDSTRIILRSHTFNHRVRHTHHLNSLLNQLTWLTRLGTSWDFRTSGNLISRQLQHQVSNPVRDSFLGTNHSIRSWTGPLTFMTTWANNQTIVTPSFQVFKHSEGTQVFLRQSTCWRVTKAKAQVISSSVGCWPIDKYLQYFRSNFR